MEVLVGQLLDASHVDVSDNFEIFLVDFRFVRNDSNPDGFLNELTVPFSGLQNIGVQQVDVLAFGMLQGREIFKQNEKLINKFFEELGLHCGVFNELVGGEDIQHLREQLRVALK